MQSLIIKIHSFIDVITNSSTEIFVQANDKTIKNVKDMVTAILGLGGSSLTFDDLFTVSLHNTTKEDYEDYEDEDEDYERDESQDNIRLDVKPLVDSKNAKIASNILSSLSDLFEIEERYN